ncbi:MAG: sulfatase [Verrucomicrobia bacterium]|nr:sulfatase [Verrucomicrobiota bacterium]
MKSTIITGLLFLGLLSWAACAQKQKPTNKDKPNVLFIAIDDLNDWIEPLEGLPASMTPNFVRFAKMSKTFTNAHCASPACSPSRISVMTGVHPATSGIMKNIAGDGPVWRQNSVLSNVQTIEQFFREKGYKTLAGGKIYHTLAPPRTIINQGEPESWDFWFPSAHIPIPFQVRAPEDVIYPQNTIGEIPSAYFTWGPIPVDDDKMADYHIVDWAIHELSRDHDKPLFLAVGLTKPHDPWEVPQKYFDKFPLDSIPSVESKKNDVEDAFDHGRRQLHKFILQNNQEKKVIQSYLASVSFTDAMLGRLLDGLAESRFKDNTIIVLWSDHGMHMGEKENWEKFTLWERSTRVPLFIVAPGITNAGTKTDATVSLLDIYPTLAELIGETPPKHCDGVSLVPLLKDQKFTHDPVVMAYQFREDNAYAVRSSRYRYIYYPFIGLEELYDLETDKHEWNNIAYKSDIKTVIVEHRKYLLDKVPDLKWTNKVPAGYKLLNDDTIRKIDFLPMERIVYKNEWY